MGEGRGRLTDAVTRAKAIELVKEAVVNGARKHKACEVIDISVRTLVRWEAAYGLEDKRRSRVFSPNNKLTEAERAAILSVINSMEYAHLPPCQIVPRLADKGQYLASESTLYRLLRAEKLLAHRGHSHAKRYHKPAELVATNSNQIWSWDITFLPTQVMGIFYYLYMVIDIYSRKIVGWTVETSQTAEHAAKLMTTCCSNENISRNQVTLHSDNGKPMKGATMLSTLQMLGIMPSFSRPAVSDDNPYSESLFKTVKYCPFYPKDKFATLEDAMAWVKEFVVWYNIEHHHSGIRFVTPMQRHLGLDEGILAHREAVYGNAKRRTPCRWSGNTRNWKPDNTVILNPATTTTVVSEVLQAA